MTLDNLELYKFEFSQNFARFCRFGRQQQLNFFVIVHAPLSRGYLSEHLLSLASRVELFYGALSRLPSLLLHRTLPVETAYAGK